MSVLSSNRSAVDAPLSQTPTMQIGTKDAKLTRTAKEFESILLGQWLQGAESSFGSVPGGENDSDAGDEQVKGFAVQQLAKSLSDSGGIGIAKLVLKALDQPASTSAAAHEVHGGAFRCPARHYSRSFLMLLTHWVITLFLLQQ